MGNCQDVGRLITPYLDEEVGAADRQAVEAHLQACQPCARRAAAEKTVRRVVMVKAASLSATAPDALRERCAALATKPKGQRRWVLLGWRAVSLATASLVVLGLAGTLLYGVVTHSPTVLAAELALDHVKCFALFEPRVAAADAAAVAKQLEADYGWRLDVPASSPADRLTLIGARRCLSTDGRVAHVLYRHNGTPVSLFIMPGTSRPETRVSVAGHVARVWTRGDTTYVMVGSESEPDLRPVAAYFQSARR
jgi:mycothiol system anti-sigma-R factor